MKKRSLFALLISALALSACDFSLSSLNPFKKVKSVKLSQESVEVGYGETSSEIKVTLEGTGNFNKGVKLVSEDEKISKASYTAINSGETFKVYGVGVGQTKINVISIGDSSKAASLSVTVKEASPVSTAEVTSITLSESTHLFKISDDASQSDGPLSVSVTINGRGDYDKTAKITLTGDAVTLDKTSVTSGGTFKVSPAKEGSATIKVISNGNAQKIATLSVRVEKITPPAPVEDRVYLTPTSKELVEGQSFNVTATKEGTKTIQWSLKEADAGEYISIEGTPSDEGATVKALKPTPEGKVATLVATLGEAHAECAFTVKEKEHLVKTFYVTNNDSLGYEHMYLYMWNEAGESNAQWPGVELTNKVKNANEEDCFVFEADVAEYSGFLFNDGGEGEANHKTKDCFFEAFGETNNNIWFDAEGEAHYAVIELDVPTIRFDKKYVSLYPNDVKTYSFVCRKGTAAYSVESGEEFIDVKEITNGTITVEAKAVGNAEIKVFIAGEGEGAENLAEDILHVEVLDPTNLKEVYFTNNKGWEHVYVYTWDDGGDQNAAWPGVELTEPLKNKYNEPVFKFDLDVKKWSGLIFNNGLADEAERKTADITVDEVFITKIATTSNLYPDGEESPYGIGYATFEAWAEKVEFAKESVYVEKDSTATVGVSANAEGVEYAVTAGSDVVEISEHSDSSITLHYLKDGEATVTATLGESSDTLAVTCTSSEIPADLRTIYVTNNLNWEKVYLYTWKGEVHPNGDWPGQELKDPVKNMGNEDVYVVQIDANKVDSFVINNGLSDAAERKSADVLVEDENFATNNNIWFKGESSPYEVGFANFEAWAEKVEFAKEEVTVGEGTDVKVSVTANAEGVTYVVTEGADVVSIAAHSDSEITLHFLKEGTATVTATLGESTDTLSVTCTDEVVPSETKTIYVSNSKHWDHVYLYTWKGSVHPNGDWPGEELTNPIATNDYGEDIYAIELDPEEVDSFIINNGSGQQSADISLADEHFGENNQIYFTGSGSPFTVGFTTYTPASE